MSRHGVLLGAACLSLAACSSSEEANVASVGGAQAPLAVTTPIDPLPDPAMAADANALAPLTAQGWGPLTIGMTLAEITAALGPDAEPNAVGGADPESCDQFRPERAPEGMLLMVEDGRLTRISLIREAKVKADRGLGLGIAAAEVRAAYGDKIQSTPHKYGEPPQEYLTVWVVGGGPADGIAPPGSRGIQYEVNLSGNVGAIHAGGPSILYVEGCA